MEEKLDFSLPEKKRRNTVGIRVCILLLLVLVGLASANLFVLVSGSGGGPEPRAEPASAGQTKQLASRLAQRNLYRPAAKAWQEYLADGGLSDGERAKAHFQIGVLLEKAGLFEEAIEHYYRSELAAKLDELEPQVNSHVKDCFEKLGKFSALRYELMDRTNFKKSQDAGTKVVAEIGAEKITEADLDAAIEGDIENRLSPWAAFMTAEQLGEQKRRMLEQLRSPESRQQFLQKWVTQEILYRQALEERLSERAEVKKLLNDQARGILSQHLMNQELAAKIHITETDLQTYYNANKQSYVEPAKARISHILVEDEQEARGLIGRIKGGEDFAELAKELSKDDATAETGGKIDMDVGKGSYVAGIGNVPELNEKIFAAGAPTLLDEPVKTDKGWEIVRVDEKQPERQKSFDEVREQVMSTLLSKKREDVQREYIKAMMDKYNVVIHTSALTGAAEGDSEDSPSKRSK